MFYFLIEMGLHGCVYLSKAAKFTLKILCISLHKKYALINKFKYTNSFWIKWYWDILSNSKAWQCILLTRMWVHRVFQTLQMNMQKLPLWKGTWQYIKTTCALALGPSNPSSRNSPWRYTLNNKKTTYKQDYSLQILIIYCNKLTTWIGIHRVLVEWIKNMSTEWGTI